MEMLEQGHWNYIRHTLRGIHNGIGKGMYGTHKKARFLQNMRYDGEYGGANVISFAYDSSQDERIVSFEKSTFDKCLEMMASYPKMISELGCELELVLFWYNWRTKQVSAERLPFIHGYLCGISGTVLKDGKMAITDEEEGEALSFCTFISSIDMSWGRNEVILFDDLEEFIDTMNAYLEWVRENLVH